MPEFRLAVSAFALMITTISAEADAQSLSEAYAAALHHDPDQAVAAADRDASQENEPLAASLFRPKVQIEGRAGYSRITSDLDDASSVLPDKVDGVSGGVLIGVEQPLIDGTARAQDASFARAPAREMPPSRLRDSNWPCGSRKPIWMCSGQATLWTR
jgi:outer membrane protein